jgi:hypothetical protein
MTGHLSEEKNMAEVNQFRMQRLAETGFIRPD